MGRRRDPNGSLTMPYSPSDKPDPAKKVPVSQRFFTACLLILAGVVAIWIALELLAQFWGWIVLILALGLTGWVIYRVIVARQNRW